MDDKYDVIITGASFAGLYCAKELANSHLKILIIEKNKEYGIKTCASGVTEHDLMFIPKRHYNYPLSSIFLVYKGKKVQMPAKHGEISSIDRKEVINDLVSSLTKYNNIVFINGDEVIELKANSVITKNGQNIQFKYLVGADGSTSIIRRKLNLTTEKLIVAVQYIVPEIYKNFEIHILPELFGQGYAWIFPNKKFTSVGCAMDKSHPDSSNINQLFREWLKKVDIQIVEGKFEGFVINYDFKGYKFGNIYLAGDAAGLASGLTGKGIFNACASGIQIANEIKNLSEESDLINKALARKKQEESYINSKVNFLLMQFQQSILDSSVERKHKNQSTK